MSLTGQLRPLPLSILYYGSQQSRHSCGYPGTGALLEPHKPIFPPGTEWDNFSAPWVVMLWMALDTNTHTSTATGDSGDSAICANTVWLSGGTGKHQSLAVPQGPARAGRGKGTSWHCWGAGEQAESQKPGHGRPGELEAAGRDPSWPGGVTKVTAQTATAAFLPLFHWSVPIKKGQELSLTQNQCILQVLLVPHRSQTTHNQL